MAISSCLQNKTEEIILEANKYKIILASPSTLISVLKIIDNMWSINERNKNADLDLNPAQVWGLIFILQETQLSMVGSRILIVNIIVA